LVYWRRADDALDVDARVVVKIRVLCGDQSLAERLRNVVILDEDPPLFGERRHLGSVRREDLRHHRRVVVFQGPHVGQVET
jgi:hypothetical protein